jgi:hypothetical protein
MNKITILIICFVALFSCRKTATKWNSSYVVPILNDQLSLESLVNDSTLSVDSMGAYYLDLHRELYRMDLNDLAAIPDTTIATEYSTALSFTVAPGFAFVNTIEENELELSEIVLKKVRCKKGIFEVELKNPYETKVNFSLQLVGVSKNGQPFIANAIAGPGQKNNPTIITRTFDLGGYDLDLTGVDGGKSNTLQSIVTVQTDPNGSSVYSTPSYVTRVNATLKNIELDYARGYFGQQIIEDTVTTSLDFFKQITNGYIDLPNVLMNLSLKNGVKVDAKITVDKVMGTNTMGQSVDLTHVFFGSAKNVNRAGGSWAGLSPSVLTFEFNENNSNINSFLENLNSDIQIVYRLEINPNGNVSGSYDEFFPNSFISFNIDLNLPLSFGLHHLVIQDTIESNFSELGTNLDRIQEANVIFHFQNAFPIELSGSLDFVDEFGASVLKVDGLKIKSSIEMDALVDSLNVSNNEFIVQLDKSKINELRNIRKVVVRAKVNSSGLANQQSTIHLTEKSFLGIKGQIAGEYAHKLDKQD